MKKASFVCDYCGKPSFFFYCKHHICINCIVTVLGTAAETLRGFAEYVGVDLDPIEISIRRPVFSKKKSKPLDNAKSTP